MDWMAVKDEHEQRLGELETEVRRLRARVAVLEPPVVAPAAHAPPAQPVAQPVRVVRAPERPVAPPPPPPPAPPRPRRDLEELLGGRVLGLAGGIAVLLGIGFLVAMAVNNGWLDESARTLLAFAGSAVLVLAGFWLHERRGRTQAARAAVAAGVAGLYASLTAATRLYDLIPLSLALAAAVLVAALAVAIAVRWSSSTVASLGIGGALLAPALVGADPAGPTVAFVLIVMAAAGVVVIRQGWRVIALGALPIAFTQIGSWVATGPTQATVVVAVAAAWCVGTAVALGLAARRDEDGLLPVSVVLITGTSLFALGAGCYGLYEEGDNTAICAWLAGLALAHTGLGLAVRRSSTIANGLAALSLGTGLVVADLALVAMLNGPAVAVGLAGAALALAALARWRSARGDAREAALASWAVASQLALAIGHVLVVDASPGLLASPSTPVLGPVLALVLLFAALAGAARVLPVEGTVRVILDAIALGTIAYLSAYALDDQVLALAWVAEAVVLVAVARATRLPYGVEGSALLLVMATGHALVFEAAPRALVYGVGDLWQSAAALAAVAIGALAAARIAPRDARELRLGLQVLGAATLVYLGSVAIVTAFQPTEQTLGGGLDLGLLSVRQQGQLLLSGFWSVTGVAALVAGLRRPNAYVRWGGFALLGIATGKVFLFDLSALESMYRVGSFVALGLLLLGGAFAYQRLRGGNAGPQSAAG
jgi:uncharacterized membrane protein